MGSVSEMVRRASLSGMTCTTSDIDIKAINAGSVIIDYTVTVPPSLATPALRQAAVAAVEDPTTVGGQADAMQVTIGGETAEGATAMAFMAYAWIKTEAPCPSTCGQAASTPADTYACQEDGLPVADVFCETYVGPAPTSTTSCAVTADCSCEGEWSACEADCGDSRYTIIADNVILGNGAHLPSA